MGETSIQWCDFTFNPWQGCQRVSPGCVNCYAEARDQRFNRGKNWGPGGVRTRTSPENWKKPLAWNAKAAKAGVRYRVFCASLADVFEDRPELESWRFELLDLIRKTPHLDWLLLTKRPERVRSALEHLAHGGGTDCECDDDMTASGHNPKCRWAATAEWLGEWLAGIPPANVWLGTTVEDQQRADERIPELRRVPAAVRFLSCEPLLERVDITKALWPVLPSWPSKYASPEEARAAGATVTMRRQSLISKAWADSLVSWVIIGGESGPKARPFRLWWARELLAQVRAGGAAPFVKQLGADPRDDGFCRDCADLGPVCPSSGMPCAGLRDRAGGDMAEWPYDLRVREFPR